MKSQGQSLAHRCGQTRRRVVPEALLLLEENEGGKGRVLFWVELLTRSKLPNLSASDCGLSWK